MCEPIEVQIFSRNHSANFVPDDVITACRFQCGFVPFSLRLCHFPRRLVNIHIALSFSMRDWRWSEKFLYFKGKFCGVQRFCGAESRKAFCSRKDKGFVRSKGLRYCGVETLGFQR